MPVFKLNPNLQVLHLSETNLSNSEIIQFLTEVLIYLPNLQQIMIYANREYTNQEKNNFIELQRRFPNIEIYF